MNDKHPAGEAAVAAAANERGDGETGAPYARPAPEQIRRTRIGIAFVLALVAAGALAVYVLGRAGEEPAANASTTTREAPIAVRTAAAERETLELTARYTGELDADAAEIAARIGGLLEDVRVRIGDRVQRGEVLARVDTAQLARQRTEVEAQRRSALARVEQVEAERSVARSELERTEPLLDDRLVSAQEVDALRARVAALAAQAAAAQADAEQAGARAALLRQQMRDARLIAPFDGAIAARYLDPGAVVQHGTAVVRVVRRGPLRVQFRVPERDLGRVSPEQSFELTTQATGAQRFPGRVERIAAAISREDRSVAVEGVLASEHEALRPGMYAEIRLRFGSVEDAVTVPGQAVLERPVDGGGIGTGVFVVEGTTARFAEIRVVGRSGSRVAVEGVSPGTRIVTVGQERVRDGATVQVAEDTT